MVIQEDTRQKADKHALKHASFDEAGDLIFRSRLLFGDYALPPKVAVDTKEDVTEIAYNMCGSSKEKKRFSQECYTAKLCNSRLVFLIEDSAFDSINALYGHTIHLHNGMDIPGEQLAKAMYITSNRYGVEFRFCNKRDTARIIKEILQDG